jgi:hypothetical protein
MFAFDAGSCDGTLLRTVPRANRPTTLTLQSASVQSDAFKTRRSFIVRGVWLLAFCNDPDSSRVNESPGVQTAPV